MSSYHNRYILSILNRGLSRLDSIFAKREVAFLLLGLDDLLGLLVGSQLSADSTGQLRSQENSSLLGATVKVASQSITFFSVEGSEVSGNVFADTFDLGEFAG